MAGKRKFSSLPNDASTLLQPASAKKAKVTGKKAHGRQSGEDVSRGRSAAIAPGPESSALKPKGGGVLALSETLRPGSSSAIDEAVPPPGLSKGQMKKWRRKSRQSLREGKSPAVAASPEVEVEAQQAASGVRPSTGSFSTHAQKSDANDQHRVIVPLKAVNGDLLRRASTTKLVSTPRKMWTDTVKTTTHSESRKVRNDRDVEPLTDRPKHQNTSVISGNHPSIANSILPSGITETDLSVLQERCQQMQASGLPRADPDFTLAREMLQAIQKRIEYATNQSHSLQPQKSQLPQLQSNVVQSRETRESAEPDCLLVGSDTAALLAQATPVRHEGSKPSDLTLSQPEMVAAKKQPQDGVPDNDSTSEDEVEIESEVEEDEEPPRIPQPTFDTLAEVNVIQEQRNGTSAKAIEVLSVTESEVEQTDEGGSDDESAVKEQVRNGEVEVQKATIPQAYDNSDSEDKLKGEDEANAQGRPIDRPHSPSMKSNNGVNQDVTSRVASEQPGSKADTEDEIDNKPVKSPASTGTDFEEESEDEVHEDEVEDIAKVTDFSVAEQPLAAVETEVSGQADSQISTDEEDESDGDNMAVETDAPTGTQIDTSQVPGTKPDTESILGSAAKIASVFTNGDSITNGAVAQEQKPSTSTYHEQETPERGNPDPILGPARVLESHQPSRSSTPSSVFAGIKTEATIARLGVRGLGPMSQRKAIVVPTAADTQSAFDRFSNFVGGDESSDDSDSDSETEVQETVDLPPATAKSARPGVSEKAVSSPGATSALQPQDRSTGNPLNHTPITRSVRKTDNIRASQQLEHEAEVASQELKPDSKLDHASLSIPTQLTSTDEKRHQAKNGAKRREDYSSRSEDSADDTTSETEEDSGTDEQDHNALAANDTKSVITADDMDRFAYGGGISKGDSENVSGVAPIPAQLSRTPTTSNADTPDEEGPDSRTSISAFSDHLDIPSRRNSSLVRQQLRGEGFSRARTRDVIDAPTPSNSLRFADSEGEDVFDTIDEVASSVFNSTRPLIFWSEQKDSEPCPRSALKVRSLVEVFIPRVPSEVIACYSMHVDEEVLQPRSPNLLERQHNLNAGDVGDIGDVGSDPDINGPPMPYLALRKTSSSLSELGSSPSPPPDSVVHDSDSHSMLSTKAIPETVGKVHVPVLADGDDVSAGVKKRRKMTGTTSKHFSPEKRTRLEQKRVDDNTRRFDEMLADEAEDGPAGTPKDPHTPRASSTIVGTPDKRTPRAKRKSTGKKSDHFLSPYLDRVDMPSPVKGKVVAGVSRAVMPPISAKHFGIIQEKLWQEPFWLLIAVTFLNQTAGRQAAPVFWSLKTRYITAEGLSKANFEDVLKMVRCLGLQNLRAKRVISIAENWVAQPPVLGRRYKTRNYPAHADHRRYNKVELIEDAADCKGALEIAHLPGLGAYAWDSWRIFCRDVLRGVAEDYNGKGAAAEAFEPEWQRVIPLDKELRATLRWMWLREGHIWDHFTGDKRRATEEEMARAVKGSMDVGDVKEGKFAVQAAGVSAEMEGTDALD
ncbi:hypothetical protein LTR62_004876 [Meristemomyces frigidus]|uniref:HhH-GPD domain-containing protein n=1 Tax=Meristemomyces frigidus TaxID=1508187 RepID=A0AAN7TG01_9PEZI|nr:hypothetical protein LTR62_004876 [Meristemomyces frigidus]